MTNETYRMNSRREELAFCGELDKDLVGQMIDLARGLPNINGGLFRVKVVLSEEVVRKLGESFLWMLEGKGGYSADEFVPCWSSFRLPMWFNEQREMYGQKMNAYYAKVDLRFRKGEEIIRKGFCRWTASHASGEDFLRVDALGRDDYFNKHPAEKYEVKVVYPLTTALGSLGGDDSRRVLAVSNMEKLVEILNGKD